MPDSTDQLTKKFLVSKNQPTLTQSKINDRVQ